MFSDFRTLVVVRDSVDPSVIVVNLNRPRKLNAVNMEMLRELHKLFSETLVSVISTLSAVVLTGSGGRAFTSGLDLRDPEVVEILTGANTVATSVGERSVELKNTIDAMQRPILSIASFPRPVIAAVSGLCIGLGVDLICACDIRLSEATSQFSVREVKIGICADLGSLFFLPRIVRSDSWVREVCFTGRIFGANEAFENGLISSPLPGSVQDRALTLARDIASNPAIALEGIKAHLNHSLRDRMADNFSLVSLWNSVKLQDTKTVQECVQKIMSKL